MIAHSHSTFVEGCFRCDLSREEVTMVASMFPDTDCPECVQGKHGNCTGWALNDDDEVVECECARGGHA